MSGLLTTIGQYQIRDLLMGPGTDYTVRPGTTPHAWPEVRAEDVAYDAHDGVLPTNDLMGARRVPLRVMVRGGSRGAAWQNLQNLQAAWAPSTTDLELAWMDDLGTFRYVGRPRLADPDESLARVGAIEVECRFLATSPFYASTTDTSGTTARVLPGSGFTPPFTPPFTLGASTGGTIRVSNAGTAAAPWTARLDGPLTDPTIGNLTSGDRLAFTANGGLDLGAGEFVEIASDGRSVLLAGTASRRSQLSLDSRWWVFPPGDTDLELTADAGTGTLSVTTRDTYY